MQRHAEGVIIFHLNSDESPATPRGHPAVVLALPSTPPLTALPHPAPASRSEEDIANGA